MGRTQRTRLIPAATSAQDAPSWGASLNARLAFLFLLSLLYFQLLKSVFCIFLICTSTPSSIFFDEKTDSNLLSITRSRSFGQKREITRLKPHFLTVDEVLLCDVVGSCITISLCSKMTFCKKKKSLCWFFDLGQIMQLFKSIQDIRETLLSLTH